MESTRVTLGELRTQAAKVDEEAQGYYNEYQNLLREVETLTSSDWRGEAADAFREKVKNFEPDFNKMKELMNEYAAFLRNAADNYRNTQENVMGVIRGLR